MVLCEHKFSNQLCKYLSVGLLDVMVKLSGFFSSFVVVVVTNN